MIRDMDAAYRDAAMVLGMMRKHTARVERAEAVTRGGVTSAVYAEIISGIPCGFDIKPSGYGDKGVFAGAESTHTCYLAPDADIKEGDRIWIDLGGGEKRFSVGAVVHMNTHTEAALGIAARA